MGKTSYYHSAGSFQKKRSKRWLFLLVVPVLGLATGGYVYFLIQSPNFTVGATPIETSEQQLREADTNYLKITKLGIAIPLTGSNDLTSLKAGAGYQTSDSGNPETGGNLAIGALRFQLGLTPSEIKTKSPFYQLDKLAEGDVVNVIYNGKEYSYEVTKVRSTEPRDESVTASSNDTKLTLYTATTTGVVDGKTVIEAMPLFESANSSKDNDGTPLL